MEERYTEVLSEVLTEETEIEVFREEVTRTEEFAGEEIQGEEIQGEESREDENLEEEAQPKELGIPVVGEDGRVPVVSVRFRTAGKAYYFDPCGLTFTKGMHVIVETARGLEFGTVAAPSLHVAVSAITPPLRPVIRIATEQDAERETLNREKEREAIRICKEKVSAHELEMKLIDAEYTFDNSKLLFYFTADGRVDFRDLVKDLASVFRTRIELRQIGVRDETQRLGGYGSCGRPLCCHTWLSEFIPVSIKMAKEQNLSLNQSKISGVCGRLMCCLKNEVDTYEELNKNLPKPGDEVEGSDGLSGIVESVNVLRQTVRILVDVNDEKEFHEYEVGDFTILRRRRKGGSKSSPQKENKDSKGGADSKENKDAKQPRDNRETKENGDSKDNKGAQNKNKNKDKNRRKNRRQAEGDSNVNEQEAGRLTENE